MMKSKMIRKNKIVKMNENIFQIKFKYLYFYIVYLIIILLVCILINHWDIN
jgi:hypothetical protein